MKLTKQELARKRNWFKFQITGVPISRQHIDRRCLTSAEQFLVDDIQDSLKRLNEMFEDNSRKLGLKVPKHRCWCGKEGKYPISKESKELFNNIIEYVCFKHKE